MDGEYHPEHMEQSSGRYMKLTDPHAKEVN